MPTIECFKKPPLFFVEMFKTPDFATVFAALFE
jgi:hypothetical protein